MPPFDVNATVQTMAIASNGGIYGRRSHVLRDWPAEESSHQLYAAGLGGLPVPAKAFPQYPVPAIGGKMRVQQGDANAILAHAQIPDAHLGPATYCLPSRQTSCTSQVSRSRLCGLISVPRR